VDHCYLIVDYNSVLDFSQYELHATMLETPSLLLHDSSGGLLKMTCPSPAGTCDVFDFTNPKTVETFIAVCVNATQTGFVDGCYLDRAVDGVPENVTAGWNTAHLQMQADLQAAIGRGAYMKCSTGA